MCAALPVCDRLGAGAHDDHDMNIRGVFLHVLGDALGSVGVVLSGIFIKYTRERELSHLGGSSAVRASAVC